MKIRKNLLELHSLPDPSVAPGEDAYWPYRFVLGEVKDLTVLRVEASDRGRPSPGMEAYASEADTAALFRYLGTVVLPKVERHEDRSTRTALTGVTTDWRVGGITYATLDHRTGEVQGVGCTGPEELRNLLACLLAAEAEVSRG